MNFITNYSKENGVIHMGNGTKTFCKQDPSNELSVLPAELVPNQHGKKEPVQKICQNCREVLTKLVRKDTEKVKHRA